MTDLAVLGLAVDSSQVKRGTTDLNALSKAARDAADKADALSRASSSAAKGSETLAKSGTKSESAMRAMEAAAKRAGVSVTEWQKRYEDAIKNAGKHNAVVTSLAAQHDRLTLATSRTSLVAGSFYGNILSQVAYNGSRRVVDGLIRMNAEMARTYDLSHRLAINSGTLQGVVAAGGSKGIGGDDVLDQMAALSRQVDLAKRGLGDLNQLFRANGLKAKDSTDAFFKLADLVKNASDETSKMSILQTAGITSNAANVRLYEQGADALRRQVEEAKKLPEAHLKAARDLEDTFNEQWTRWKREGQSAILALVDFANQPQYDMFANSKREITSIVNFLKSAGGYVSGLFSGGSDSADRTIPFQKPAWAQAAANSYNKPDWTKAVTGFDSDVRGSFGNFTNPTFDLEREKAVQAQLAQRLGMLAQIGGVEAQMGAARQALYLQELNGLRITGTERKKILAVYELQFNAQNLSARAELGLANATDIANQKAREMASLVQNGTIRFGEQSLAAEVLGRKYQELADRVKVAASAFPQLTQFLIDAGNLNKQLDQFGTSSLNSLGSSLVDYQMGVKSAGDATKDFEQVFIRSLLNMMNQMLIIQPIAQGLKSLLGGIVGAGGFSLSSLFSGGAASSLGGGLSLTSVGGLYHSGGIVGSEATSFRNVHPAYFDEAPRYHSGLLPDEFPAILQKGEGVFTRGQMAALGRGGGNIQAVNVTVNNAPAGTTVDPSKTQATMGQNGQIDLRLWLQSEVRGIISDDVGKGGPITKTMRAVARGYNGS